MRKQLSLTIQLSVGIYCLGGLGANSHLGHADEIAVPPVAAQHGMNTLTFYSNFNSDDVALEPGNACGKKWGVWNLFRSKADPSKLKLNDDRTMSLLGDTTGPGGQLSTITKGLRPGEFCGKAFGGGGYFEATLKFDPRSVIARDFATWPAWWSMGLEHILEDGQSQWPGEETGFERFIEVDFFEYDMAHEVRSGKQNYFGGTIHAWYGKINTSCPNRGFCDLIPRYRVNRRAVPEGTDFNEFHNYGLLWIPASATEPGRVEWYFDGQAVGEGVTWTHYNGERPPASNPWAYSILDSSHLVLFLGTGVDEPMTVKQVQVWQISDTGNLTR
jgi:hypothetical protein